MLKITKNQGSIQVTADNSGFYPFDGTLTFPTNSLFTATSANTDMVTFKSTSNGDVQFVGNYKDITISGRSYDTKQKFLTAFSNLANQGSVDAYTKAETDAKLNDKLTAQTNANGSLFISSSSNDDANSSVALYNSTVKGSNDVAIQLASTPDNKGVHNLAILSLAEADGSQNIAIGAFRRCKGISNVGIGVGAGEPNTVDVNGQGNVCIGHSSQAHTKNKTAVNNSIAIGPAANAGANFCTVIGNSAHSKSSHAVAVGSSAEVGHDCDNSVAVGDSARAYGKGSVAIGTVSYATNDKPLEICCGQRTDGTPLSVIQSDANGKISLLKGDGTNERIVLQDALSAGGGSANPLVNVKGTNGDATISDSVTDGIAIGSSARVTNIQSIAIGASSSVSGENSIAIGDDANNTGSDCISIGYYSHAGGANDSGSVVIGSNANGYSGQTSTLIGYGANSNGFGCTGIGPTATVNETTPLAINAGYKTVGDYKQMLTMIQGDANGKISLLKGDGSDERMVIQDEIAALKNAGGSGGGTVDAYTKAETDTKLDAKQDKLTAGSGITITKDETAGTNTIATAVSLTDNGNGHYTVGNSIKMDAGIAIGKNASGYNYSVAIGNNAVSTDSFNAVIGQFAASYGGYNVAVGSGAEVGQYSNRCVAIGYSAQASNDNSVSIGNFAKANKDKPLVINAGYKTVDDHRQNLTVLQSDSTGKLSILKGDGTDERIVIQDALSAGGSGGTVDAYTKAETDNLLNAKQNTLTAGTGITIDENNVISSTGGTGGSANPLVNVKGTGSATIPDNITDAVAIGSGAKVTEELSVAIGAANALSGHCVAIGGGANATKMSSVAIGDGACATAHMFDVAIGFHAATTDTKPLEINAGYKTIGGATTPLTVLQSDKTGKLSILKGDDSDERIVISDEFAALKAEITALKAEIAALKGGASTGDASGGTTGA